MIFQRVLLCMLSKAFSPFLNPACSFPNSASVPLAILLIRILPLTLAIVDIRVIILQFPQVVRSPFLGELGIELSAPVLWNSFLFPYTSAVMLSIPGAFPLYMSPRALLISSFVFAPVLICHSPRLPLPPQQLLRELACSGPPQNALCHLSLTSSSLVSNPPSLLFTIATFLGPSLQGLLVASYTPFICPSRAASSASCAMLFIQSLLSS